MDEHVCMQHLRIMRIEQELAELEMRRQKDVELTALTLRHTVSEFNDALDKLQEARVRFDSASDKMDMLYTKLQDIAARLELATETNT